MHSFDKLLLTYQQLILLTLCALVQSANLHLEADITCIDLHKHKLLQPQESAKFLTRV